MAIVLIYLLYRNQKKITKLNLAPIISLEDSKLMTKVVTKKCLEDLKKNPKYKEVKKIAEENARKRQELRQSRLMSTQGPNYFEDFSD